MIITFTQVYRQQTGETYGRITLQQYGWPKPIRMSRVPLPVPPEVGPDGPIFRALNDAVLVLQMAHQWLRDSLLVCPTKYLEEQKQHLANLESVMRDGVLAEYTEIFETVAIDQREGDDRLNIPDGQILVPPLL